MKMSKEIYAVLASEVKAVVAKLIETGASLHADAPFDPDHITMRDMWDMMHIANTDRSNNWHPRHDAAPLRVPRVLEYTDRSPYWIWKDGDLDDSHIETAFRSIIKEIAEERNAVATPHP